jgi:hypothetical protein
MNNPQQVSVSYPPLFHNASDLAMLVILAGFVGFALWMLFAWSKVEAQHGHTAGCAFALICIVVIVVLMAVATGGMTAIQAAYPGQ